MRTITGCVRATPHQWLPVLSAITPPHLRREAAERKRLRDARDQERSNPLQTAVRGAKASGRLKSRKPFHMAKDDEWNAKEAWMREWDNARLTGGNLISDLGARQPGFTGCSRRTWVSVNRIRTRTAKVATNLQQWKMATSSACKHCGHPEQTLEHLVNDCPVTNFPGGFGSIHQIGPEVESWLQTLAALDQHI